MTLPQQLDQVHMYAASLRSAAQQVCRTYIHLVPVWSGVSVSA